MRIIVPFLTPILLFFDAVIGGLMRHMCKALEEVGILEKSTSVKGGRKLTASGQRDMDLIAGA